MESPKVLQPYIDLKGRRKNKNGKYSVPWSAYVWFPPDVDPEKVKGLCGPLKIVYKDGKSQIG